MTWFWFFLFLW